MHVFGVQEAYTGIQMDSTRSLHRFVHRSTKKFTQICAEDGRWCHGPMSNCKLLHVNIQGKDLPFFPMVVIVQNNFQMKSTKIGTHVFSCEILGVQCPVKPFPDLVPCGASPSHHHSTSPKNAQEVAGCFQVCVTRREVKWVYFP